MAQKSHRKSYRDCFKKGSILRIRRDGRFLLEQLAAVILYIGKHHPRLELTQTISYSAYIGSFDPSPFLSCLIPGTPRIERLNHHFPTSKKTRKNKTAFPNPIRGSSISLLQLRLQECQPSYFNHKARQL